MPNKLVDIDIEAVASVDKAANRRRFLIIKRADDEDVDKAMWSTAMMNDFPDSSFAYIEPGGKKDDGGKTIPRSLRHLPYKDANGKIDPAHVRNALARMPQTMIPDAAKEQARGKLVAAARQVGIEVSKQDDNEPGLIQRVLQGIGKALGWSPEQYQQASKAITKADHEEEPMTTTQVLEHRKAMDEFWELRSAFMTSLNSIMEAPNHPEHAAMLQRTVKEFADTASPVIARMQMHDMKKAETVLEDLDAAVGDIAKMSEVIKAFAPPGGQDKDPVNPNDLNKRSEESMKLADVLKAMGIDLDKQVESQPSGGGTNTAAVAKVEESEEVKKQFEDLRKQAEESKAQVAELRKAAEDAEARAKAAEEVAKAEQEKRVQREYLEKAAKFPHAGKPEEVAAMLRKADEAGIGEQLVASWTAQHEAIEKGDLFKEFGRSGSAISGGDAWNRIEKKAEEIAKRDGCTAEQAQAKYLETADGRRDYAEYQREMQGVN